MFSVAEPLATLMVCLTLKFSDQVLTFDAGDRAGPEAISIA